MASRRFAPGSKPTDDERAAKCLELLKGTKWKLQELEKLVAGGTGTAPDDTQLAALRDLAQLSAPDAETITQAARELRDALEECSALAGTDTEKARPFADILEKALSPARRGLQGCPRFRRFLSKGGLENSGSWKSKAAFRVLRPSTSPGTRSCTRSINPRIFILAIVEFDGDSHYVRTPFQREPDFGVTSVNYDFAELLARAEPPR